MLKYLFFYFFIKPIILIGLGLNIRNYQHFPKQGPAIIVANHNSHLDTLVLMTLAPGKLLGKMRPVAAMDYFCRNRFFSWLSQNFLGIVPIKRKRTKEGEDLLQPCYEALEKKQILILYPEGTRGKPEEMAEFKSGIARLVENYSHVPVHPVYMHGLGKTLPKGSCLPVPFFCDVFVGEKIMWNGEKQIFLNSIRKSIDNLKKQGNFPIWK
ncbi:lysophospholipid acyltransferase family protein [Candidatus Uabimicrobium sp. HlEnr_7]|uniref:lysophospholipid acyltransferase family protein n=1 Tax=Candidatus Uabimicrobium helgolandensis TaxID=3095367 RepID=UPI003557FAC3